MDELLNQSFYNDIKDILKKAREKVYSAANFVMVSAYWNIGKKIYEECGENERAAYGKQVLQEL